MKKTSTNKPLYWGTWGNLRAKYLLKNEPKLYYALQAKGKLELYLDGYQEAYTERQDQLVERYEKKFQVYPELRTLNYPLYLSRKMQALQAVRQELTKQIMR